MIVVIELRVKRDAFQTGISSLVLKTQMEFGSLEMPSLGRIID